jgi:hypothetical protein
MKTPNGRSAGGVPSPDLESPEEGTYQWHLQRVKNMQAFSWLVLGTSCAEIRDRKLYEPDFDDWRSFCKVELQQTPSTVNRWIAGSVLALELQGAGCQPLPTCERQVRPLGLLRVPFERIEAWNKACGMKSPGYGPTAADVLREVRRMMPIPPSVNMANVRKVKRELARSTASVTAALTAYSEPDVSEYLQSAAGLRERRLIHARIERIQQLLSGLNVEKNILL